MCKNCNAEGDIQFGLCADCRREADRQWAESNGEPVSDFDTPSHNGHDGWSGSLVQEIDDYRDDQRLVEG